MLCIVKMTTKYSLGWIIYHSNNEEIPTMMID